MEKKKGNSIKTRRINFSQSAFISLLEIEKYIAEHLASPLNAIKVIESIHSKIERVSKCPTAYKRFAFKKVDFDVRQALCKSWYIFFTFSDEELHI